jgi:type I restriction enzyme S subunit
MGRKQCLLGEIVKFGNGKSRPNTEGIHPIYGGNGILGYTSETNYEGEIIVIGRVGAYCGATYYENRPIWVSDNALAAIPIENNNAKYLYYFLKNMDLNQHAQGSSHPLVTQTLLNSLDIEISDEEPEQKAIASVLSSLDDKIDLLHRQNKTLEAMAETLFRQWFVEEAQEDWEEKPLSEVTKIAIGRTPPRKESQWFSTNSKNVKWVSIKDLGQSGIFVFDTSEYLTQEAVETFNIPIIPIDTVLLSFKMTVGRVGITTEPMLSNEAIAHFKFDENTPFSKEYLYIWLKTFKYDSLGSTSSIVTAINSSMIKETEIVIPDDTTMNNFQAKTEPLFNKIEQNQAQICTLEKLRDTLLPKLISGVVRMET